jgi:FimV-like protein
MTHEYKLSYSHAIRSAVDFARHAADELQRMGLVDAEPDAMPSLVRALTATQIRNLGRRGVLPTEELERLAVEAVEAVEAQAAESLNVPDLEPVTLSEVGTKLDLARAYLDMGDPDGARDILNEVLRQEPEASERVDKMFPELEKLIG